jgi:hypothetical protein
MCRFDNLIKNCVQEMRIAFFSLIFITEFSSNYCYCNCHLEIYLVPQPIGVYNTDMKVPIYEWQRVKIQQQKSKKSSLRKIGWCLDNSALPDLYVKSWYFVYLVRSSILLQWQNIVLQFFFCEIKLIPLQSVLSLAFGKRRFLFLIAFLPLVSGCKIFVGNPSYRRVLLYHRWLFVVSIPMHSCSGAIRKLNIESPY